MCIHHQVFFLGCVSHKGNVVAVTTLSLNHWYDWWKHPGVRATEFSCFSFLLSLLPQSCPLPGTWLLSLWPLETCECKPPRGPGLCAVLCSIFQILRSVWPCNIPPISMRHRLTPVPLDGAALCGSRNSGGSKLYGSPYKAGVKKVNPPESTEPTNLL